MSCRALGQLVSFFQMLLISLAFLFHLLHNSNVIAAVSQSLLQRLAFQHYYVSATTYSPLCTQMQHTALTRSGRAVMRGRERPAPSAAHGSQGANFTAGGREYFCQSV
jgi:hypothetical protein